MLTAVHIHRGIEKEKWTESLTYPPDIGVTDHSIIWARVRTVTLYVCITHRENIRHRVSDRVKHSTWWMSCNVSLVSLTVLLALAMDLGALDCFLLQIPWRWKRILYYCRRDLRRTSDLWTSYYHYQEVAGDLHPNFVKQVKILSPLCMRRYHSRIPRHVFTVIYHNSGRMKGRQVLSHGGSQSHSVAPILQAMLNWELACASVNGYCTVAAYDEWTSGNCLYGENCFTRYLVRMDIMESLKCIKAVNGATFPERPVSGEKENENRIIRDSRRQG